MDWFPLFNSIRIALISTVIIFFVGIFAAYYIAKAPRLVKGVLDVFLTLPRPSISIASRLTKCAMLRLSWAGHSAPVQRRNAPSSSRSVAAPQTGQWLGRT